MCVVNSDSAPIQFLHLTRFTSYRLIDFFTSKFYKAHLCPKSGSPWQLVPYCKTCYYYRRTTTLWEGIVFGCFCLSVNLSKGGGSRVTIINDASDPLLYRDLQPSPPPRSTVLHPAPSPKSYGQTSSF